MLVIEKKKKKTDYDAKILDIEFKDFTSAGYNKFTYQTVDAKIREKGLVHKSTVAGFYKQWWFR